MSPTSGTILLRSFLMASLQRAHATGVGIIENDVPYIPFHEKYVESLVA